MSRCRDCVGRLWPWRRFMRNPKLCRACERWYDREHAS